MLKAEDKNWVEETLAMVEQKLRRTVLEIETCFPYTTTDGQYEKTVDELPLDGICWWTNGFWAGILWLMYLRTGDALFREKAEACELALDDAFRDYDRLHHDVGFMWLTSAVANYRITGSDTSRKRGLLAADILAARYNMAGKFIRAWGSGDCNRGTAIIDCMMNIPLLYWASEQVDDPRYRYIAEQHAKSTMAHHIRPDGSSNHIVIFDQDTGEIVTKPRGQGFAEGSSWSRGQAWALYGFALSYLHTHNEEFLTTAKRAAHYFIANVADEHVARCDFRAPAEPVIYDSTAGVIAACGLIELARVTPETERQLYLDNALAILRATAERFCDWSASEQSILQMGTGAYHDKTHHYPIIYGDYYFIEALMKLAGNDVLFW